MKRQVCAPDVKTENPDAANGEAGPRRCATDGCPHEGIYPAPRSRDALRDIYGSVLTTSAPITRHGIIMTACKAPPSKPRYAAPQPGNGQAGNLPPASSDGAFADPLGLFDFDKRDPSKPGRLLSAEERAAWDTLKLSPVDDLAIVKKQYKQLVKENHPDKNGGDARAEERLKEINLAFSLIRKNLTKGSKTAAF